MAIVADFEEEEASVIRSLRCILFIFVSVPPASLLYKYLEYMVIYLIHFKYWFCIRYKLPYNFYRVMMDRIKVQ